MGDVAQKARRVRVTMIPEGQQLFADGVEVKVGDTFAEGAQVVGKRTVTLTEGAAVPPARAFGIAIMDDVRVGLALPEGAPPGFPVQPAPVAWWSYPGDVAASAEPAPLTEAELAEIEGRTRDNDVEIRGCLCTGCTPDLAQRFVQANEDVPRLLADLRRAQKRIVELAEWCDGQAKDAQDEARGCGSDREFGCSKGGERDAFEKVAAHLRGEVAS